VSAKHTPGPWEYPEHAYILSGSDDGPNFSGGDWEVLPPLGESGPVAICSSRENARLIAAAPDLLDALKLAAIITPHNRAGIHEECENLCACCKFEASIKKAEGRA